MANLKNTNIDNNLELPQGTTGERPASPQEGQIRYNTDLSVTEFYNGENWRPLSDNGIATSYDIEIITNGNFSDGVNGWTVDGVSTSTSGNTVTLNGSGDLTQQISLTAGKTYKISANVKSIENAQANLKVDTDSTGAGGTVIDYSTAPGHLSGTFQASSNSIYVAIQNGQSDSSSSITWSDVSVRENSDSTVVDTDIGGVPYRIHYFTNVGTNTLTVTNPGEVDVLVVAGGGGGGSGNPDRGGGGAGGVVLRQGYYLDTQSYSVTVGDGAEGGDNNNPDNGSDSVFGSLTALGGGSADGFGDGNSGGSGAGGGGGGAGGSALQPGSGAAGLGNNGGNGNEFYSDGQDDNSGGGGGGAGGPGGDGTLRDSDSIGTPVKAGSGGPGIYIGNLFPSAGVNGFIAGGGGGSSRDGLEGSGGLGGGTAGGDRGTAANCPPNTGSGAGGGENGGRGGSGIVIVRYPRNSSLDSEPDRTTIATQPNRFQTVRDGLVLELDAGNPVSYPGSGSTWRDLSRTANNGTIISDAMYLQQYNGVFEFDGVDDKIEMSKTYNFGPDVTVEVWFQAFSFGNHYLLNTYSGSGRWFLLNLNDSKGANWAIDDGSNNLQINSSNEILQQNTWHHLVGSYSSETETLDLYLDGNLLESNSSAYSTTYTDTVYLAGRGQDNGRQFEGRISAARLYDRGLSSQEIRHNFNATRGRYGI